MTRSPHAILLLLLAACAGGAEAPQDPATAFAQLEEALLAAPAIRLPYEIVADGAFQASLRGTLLVSQGNRLRLEGAGTFGGDSVDLALISDGSRMQWRVGDHTEEQPTPDALNQAVLLSLTRMGLLHNLARLTAAAPPDRADGTITQWVQVSDFAAAPARHGDPPGSYGIAFRMTVGGEPAGETTLSLEAETGTPVVRTQTVDFEAGEMVVVEWYGDVDLDADLPAAAFALPAERGAG